MDLDCEVRRRSLMIRLLLWLSNFEAKRWIALTSALATWATPRLFPDEYLNQSSALQYGVNPTRPACIML
jgi:hypothetical protein